MSLIITDHAMLRYLERVHGLDIEGMRTELQLRFGRAHLAMTGMGGGTYSIRHEGHQFVVRGDKVTTVLPPMAPVSRFFSLSSSD